MNPLLVLGLGAMALLLVGGKRDADSKRVTRPGKRRPGDGAPEAGAPAGWREHLSQNGLTAAQGCTGVGDGTVEDVSRCASEELFPDHEWPPPDGAYEWQKEAWDDIVGVTHVALGLDPPVG